MTTPEPLVEVVGGPEGTIYLRVSIATNDGGAAFVVKPLTRAEARTLRADLDERLGRENEP